MSHPSPDFELFLRHALRGLAAAPRRMRRMHDELLAHLLASYEEELTRPGATPDSAVASAARRLGDPATLRRQLQDSVPTLERLLFRVLRTKENSMTRRYWLLALLVVFFGTIMILPALGRHYRNHQDWTVVAYPLTLGILIALAGLTMFAYGIATRLRHRPA